MHEEKGTCGILLRVMIDEFKYFNFTLLKLLPNHLLYFLFYFIFCYVGFTVLHSWIVFSSHGLPTTIFMRKYSFSYQAQSTLVFISISSIKGELKVSLVCHCIVQFHRHRGFFNALSGSNDFTLVDRMLRCRSKFVRKTKPKKKQAKDFRWPESA